MSRNSLIELSEAERITFEQMRDHHPKPYMRERAAAILKMADGLTGKFIAKVGLLKPREPQTVGDWRHRFLEFGLAGLQVRRGRGRKPRFSPSVPER